MFLDVFGCFFFFLLCNFSFGGFLLFVFVVWFCCLLFFVVFVVFVGYCFVFGYLVLGVG